MVGAFFAFLPFTLLKKMEDAHGALHLLYDYS